MQRRFHELVTDKITGAQRQIAELTALTAQLQARGPSSAINRSTGRAAPAAPVSATSDTYLDRDRGLVAMSNEPSDPAIACTLAPDRSARTGSPTGKPSSITPERAPGPRTGVSVSSSTRRHPSTS